MARLDDLLKIMVDYKASDIHITTGAPPYLRINGEMLPLEYSKLTNQAVQSLIFEILSEKQKRSFIENWELDLAYTVVGLSRFRCNVFMQRLGLAAVFRAIPEKIKTIEELGLPQSLIQLVDVPKGLVVITGPTGSGKSTTLAALIHYINNTRTSHIITIEDPIEYVHQNIKCLVNQREISSHTRSFANALRASLREDPDIILVGEMRDLETISLALTAAETGHLVFATLHTNSAHKTVDRIIDVFPAAQQSQVRTMLAESLRGVVAQQLFATVDKTRRVAAMEILKNTRAIATMIRENKTHQIPSVMETGAQYGMITFEKALEALVKKGTLSRRDVELFLEKTEKEH